MKEKQEIDEPDEKTGHDTANEFVDLPEIDEPNEIDEIIDDIVAIVKGRW